MMTYPQLANLSSLIAPVSASSASVVPHADNIASAASALSAMNTPLYAVGVLPNPLEAQNNRVPHQLVNSHAPHHPIAEFLYQLTKMLTDDNSEVIEWSQGRIKVHDPERLANEVLHKYFRHSKYASFQRQLNYFGFRKIAGKGKMSPCSYVNDGATDDLRSLLTIKRKTNGSAAKRHAQRQANESSFAAANKAKGHEKLGVPAVTSSQPTQAINLSELLPHGPLFPENALQAGLVQQLQAQSQAQIHAQAQAHAEAQAFLHAQLQAQAAQLHAPGQLATQALQAQAQHQAQTKADQILNPEAKKQQEQEQAQADMKAQAQAQAQAQVHAEAQAQLKAHLQATQSQAHAQMKAQEQAKVQVHAEAQAQAQAQLKAHLKATQSQAATASLNERLFFPSETSLAALTGKDTGANKSQIAQWASQVNNALSVLEESSMPCPATAAMNAAAASTSSSQNLFDSTPNLRSLLAEHASQTQLPTRPPLQSPFGTGLASRSSALLAGLPSSGTIFPDNFSSVSLRDLARNSSLGSLLGLSNLMSSSNLMSRDTSLVDLALLQQSAAASQLAQFPTVGLSLEPTPMPDSGDKKAPAPSS
mmetsp:Transcript_21306/g.32601  ORF Transcript_21306/g.32601 Transcript_21306/m.32601 type:complete len:591 (+) Transcript_21306:111-1883(+)